MVYRARILKLGLPSILQRVSSIMCTDVAPAGGIRSHFSNAF
ncbi:unnamed protein product [Diplocarpon coronariae]